MNIEINYLNTKLKTEVKKDIKVKELLQDLRNYFNINANNLVLLDDNHYKLNETDTIKVSKKKGKIILYLIKSSINENKISDKKKKDLNEDLNISQLIMKCTGAKKPLEKKMNIPYLRQGRFNFLDFLEQRNQEQNNRFGELINLLQELEENRIYLENDNRQIEANEQLLRELQDMGFPEDRARQALINSRNNINRATEMLLGENP